MNMQEDLERRKESLEQPVGSNKEQTLPSSSSKPSNIRSQKSIEKEVKFQLPPKDHHYSEEEEEPEEEEEVVRPPTPPRTLSKKSKHVSSFKNVF
jgi:hypothetical protein